MTRFEDFELGLSPYERYARLGAFDALLAAVARNHQAEALISADQGFGTIPNFPWIDPATEALDRFLGS